MVTPRYSMIGYWKSLDFPFPLTEGISLYEAAEFDWVMVYVNL